MREVESLSEMNHARFEESGVLPKPEPARRAEVRFVHERGIVLPLEVHAPEVGAMLRGLAEVLFELRVQIVGVAETSIGDRGAIRFEVCEFHGGPLSPRRRKSIVESLIALLDGSRRAA